VPTRPNLSRLAAFALAAALPLLLAAACSSKPLPGRDTLTQRQKDSVVGVSGLPGARGIRTAQTASDSARSRAAQVDSQLKEP
jgi:hypothetical protein